MRTFSTLISLAIFVIVVVTSGTQFASCTKEVTIRDTVTIIDKDTITVIEKDTVTIIDSSCAACYDLSEGLVAYYNFNGGTLNDSSGNNNHIVYNNASKTADRFGNPDNAYLFDGSGNYMRVAHHNSLNLGTTITLNAKIKVNGFYPGACTVNNIFDKGSPDKNVSGYYHLRFANYYNSCDIPFDADKERFSGGIENSGVIIDTFFVKTNQWYDVTYTYDGQNSLIYVNGQLKQKRIESVPPPGTNNQDLYIGKHANPPFPYWFNGVMDDIRIYNRALCEAEVRLLNKVKK